MSFYKDKWCRLTFGNSKVGPGMYLQKHNMDCELNFPLGDDYSYDKDNRFHNDSYRLIVPKISSDRYKNFNITVNQSNNIHNFLYHQDFVFSGSICLETFIWFNNLVGIAITFNSSSLTFFKMTTNGSTKIKSISVSFKTWTWYNIDYIVNNNTVYAYINKSLIGSCTFDHFSDTDVLILIEPVGNWASNASSLYIDNIFLSNNIEIFNNNNYEYELECLPRTVYETNNNNYIEQ